jgi:hypothetical protein
VCFSHYPCNQRVSIKPLRKFYESVLVSRVTYLPVRPMIITFCPPMIRRDILRKARSGDEEYETETLCTDVSPDNGHRGPGSKVQTSSSIDTDSCTLFNREIAPKEVSREAHDCTSFKRVPFATMMRLRASPMSAPVVVSLYPIVSAMRLMAINAIKQSKTTFNQHCRQRRRYEGF